MIVVSAIGGPEKPGRFVLLRVLSHLVVIPVYLLLHNLGASGAAWIAVFAALLFVITKIRTGFDPGRFTITERDDGQPQIEGKFSERSLARNAGWTLESVSLSADALELVVKQGTQTQSVSLGAESFREPTRRLLGDLLTLWLSEGSAAVAQALDAAGINVRDINGTTLAMVNERPSYAKLVFASLGSSMSVLLVLYLLYLR